MKLHIEDTQKSRWQQILVDAVNVPGKIHAAYSTFHNYSFGNQLYALWQCDNRGLQAGAINTYQGWQKLGRHVKKGEKAIELCMPITAKNKESKTEKNERFQLFIFKSRWFVLAQTDGEDVTFEGKQDWNKQTALAALGIEQIAFDYPDGNVQGYATENKVAVSPLAFAPGKTLCHECAHVLLGHTSSDVALTDDDCTPRNLKEVEAESVALILCESLGLPGAESARGYIQGWLKSDEIPERSAQKIFAVADKILKAGKPKLDGGESL